MADTEEQGALAHIHELIDKDLKDTNSKMLKRKRLEIDDTTRTAKKTFKTLLSMITKEYAKSSIAVPSSLKAAEDAIDAIDLNTSWAWHSAIMLEKPAKRKAKLNSLIKTSRMKRDAKSKVEEKKEPEAQSLSILVKGSGNAPDTKGKSKARPVARIFGQVSKTLGGAGMEGDIKK